MLSTLADQVAIAIQNAQAFETTQRYLEEAQRNSSAYLNESWRTLNPGSQSWGYLISNNNIRPLDRPFHDPLISEASAQDRPVFENGQLARLAVPIRLAGNIVGTLHIQLPEHEWESDEIDIAQAVADRLSLALESTTLLEATQKRAEIERLTADITGKIGSSTQIDSILRTAAEELSRALGTRHRAGVGLTEETDAVAIIVSEENGQISLSVGGKLETHLDMGSHRDSLNALFSVKEAAA